MLASSTSNYEAFIDELQSTLKLGAHKIIHCAKLNLSRAAALTGNITTSLYDVRVQYSNNIISPNSYVAPFVVVILPDQNTFLCSPTLPTGMPH